MKINFYPLNNASLGSSRVRVYNIAEELKKSDIDVRIYEPKNIVSFYLRFINITKPGIIYLQKASDPIVYIITKIAKLLNKKIVFDSDDNYFTKTLDKDSYNKITLAWRAFNTSCLRKIVKNSDMVITEKILAPLFKRYNNNTKHTYTSVKIDDYPKKEDYKTKEDIIITWVGNTNSTHFSNILILKEPLKKLSKLYNIKFKIFGPDNDKLKEELKDIDVEIKNPIDWKNTQLIFDEVKQADIAVAPLIDNEHTKYKGMFKVLEYMACGLPTIGSPAGDIQDYIEDNLNGFLAKDSNEWFNKIELLIKNKTIRERLGKQARKTVEEKFTSKISAMKIMEYLKELET